MVLEAGAGGNPAVGRANRRHIRKNVVPRCPFLPSFQHLLTKMATATGFSPPLPLFRVARAGHVGVTAFGDLLDQLDQAGPRIVTI